MPMHAHKAINLKMVLPTREDSSYGTEHVVMSMQEIGDYLQALPNILTLAHLCIPWETVAKRSRF